MTNGYDVVFEITLDRFVQVLKNLFIDDLPLLLGHVDIAYPVPTLTAISQRGFVTLRHRPSVSTMLDGTNRNRITLTLVFPDTQLSLEPIPASGLLGTGVAGLPLTTTGDCTVTLPLLVTTAPTGATSPITIAIDGAPTVSNLSGLDALTLPVPATVTQGALKAAIQGAATAAIRSAIESAFPNLLPIALPTSGPCNLFPRRFDMSFLPGDGTHAAALAFFVLVRAGSMGTASSFTTSLVPTANQASLTIANALVAEMLCCLLPLAPSIGGLSGVTPETADGCCRWRNLTNLRLGATTFDSASLFEICLVDGGIRVSGNLHTGGTGWYANIHFDLPLTIRASGGSLMPVSGTPTVNVDAQLEWWVWLVMFLVGSLIGAIIGGIAGGWIGALIGAIIGGIIGVIVTALLYAPLAVTGAALSAALGAVLGSLGTAISALQILPTDMTNLFGVLELAGSPVFDDVTMNGNLRLPDRSASIAECDGFLLQGGELIDLDHGVITPRYDSGANDLDADLEWIAPHARPFVDRFGRPRTIWIGGITPRSSARIARVVSDTFWSLTEDDLEHLIYASSSIDWGEIPLSDTTPPAQTLVFGVRTTEGRYAKCAAWRDSTGRVHLRFKTYATPRRLYMTEHWTTTRGAEVGAGTEGLLPYVEYLVSARGTFRATPVTLQTPITYRWYWNGAQISGAGALPDGSTTYVLGADQCQLSTPMGGTVAGELGVEATDASGLHVTATRTITWTGRERQYDRSEIDRLKHLVERLPKIPPDPIGPVSLTDAVVRPLDRMLLDAIAVGMKVKVDKLVVR